MSIVSAPSQIDDDDDDDEKQHYLQGHPEEGEEEEYDDDEQTSSQNAYDRCNSFFDLQQFFCCVGLIFFVLSVFGAMVTILIYFKPVDISVKLHSVHVYNYTVINKIEEDNPEYFAIDIITYIDFLFLAKNPSNKFTIVYSNTTFRCSTHNMSLGKFTTGAFRQKPLASTNWTRILLIDVPKPVPDSLRSSIMVDAYTNDIISLQVRGPILAHFEVAGLYFPSIEENLNCSVVFRYLDQSNVTITC